jgi:hypothetical protein
MTQNIMSLIIKTLSKMTQHKGFDLGLIAISITSQCILAVSIMILCTGNTIGQYSLLCMMCYIAIREY